MSRLWDGQSHYGGSRAAAAVADDVFVPLEPEASVVKRLRDAFEQSPRANRFVIGEERQTPSPAPSGGGPGWGHSAWVYGVPMTDTCKEVVGGIVQRTIPRESLFIAGGPWIFSREALTDAFSRIRGRESEIHDMIAFCQIGRLRVRTIPHS